MEGTGTRAASVAMKRIMKECKDMQAKKQMFVYAQPLEVSHITILTASSKNHFNGTLRSEAHLILNLKEASTTEVLRCLTNIR